MSELEAFQGDLKVLKDREYQKLRAAIASEGFLAPVFVWGSFILDGHQRIATVKRMLEEGWTLEGGKIPVVRILADNDREAAKAVLAYSSRYGKMTDDGLYEFLSSRNLSFADIDAKFEFPEIHSQKFQDNFFGEGGEVDIPTTRNEHGVDQRNLLRFGKLAIALSDEEADGFMKAYESHMEEVGNQYGFVTRLLGALR